MNNIVKSYWNADLQGKFIDNDSDTLCIILPGIAYLLDRSYLDYSKQTANELKLDVLEVEYGYQVNRSSFDAASQFDIMVDETLKVIDNSICKPYKKYVIIGKSIGTCVQNKLNIHLENKDVTNIYISPLDKTVSLGMEENSLVVTGLSDPLLSSDSLKCIKNIKGINLMTMENANHGLDVKGDIIKTIDNLKDFIIAEKNFISKNI